MSPCLIPPFLLDVCLVIHLCFLRRTLHILILPPLHEPVVLDQLHSHSFHELPQRLKGALPLRADPFGRVPPGRWFRRFVCPEAHNPGKLLPFTDAIQLGILRGLTFS